MDGRLGLNSMLAAALLSTSACNQGGETARVSKEPTAAHGSSNVTKAEPGGRYDLEFKTERECLANKAKWDADEKECYVICQPPNTFDQVDKKCVAG